MNNNDNDHGRDDSDDQGGHCGWVQSMMHNPAVDEQAKLPDWELSLVREGTIMFDANDADDLRSEIWRDQIVAGWQTHADSRGHRVECC
jgi:hypothetical protein